MIPIELAISDAEVRAIRRAERDAERGKNVSGPFRSAAELQQHLDSLKSRKVSRK